MAHDEHAVLLAELDETIGSGEVITRRLGMDQCPLQNVFRRDRIELCADNGRAARIFLEDLATVQCGTDHEVVFEYILQDSLLRSYRNAHTKKHKHQSAKRHKQISICAFLWLSCAFLWHFLWPTSQQLRV